MTQYLGQDFRVLGVRHGGMGIVYIVQDLPSLQKNIRLTLALKTFQDRYLWDADARARFEREAIRWVALGTHPHIVHALVVQEIAGKPYIWLEYVDGESLADCVARGPLPPASVISLGLQFTAGMRHAHETHHLIHRDVKPANILVTTDGVLKITDFGLAKLQNELASDVAPSTAARRLQVLGI